MKRGRASGGSTRVASFWSAVGNVYLATIDRRRLRATREGFAWEWDGAVHSSCSPRRHMACVSLYGRFGASPLLGR